MLETTGRLARLHNCISNSLSPEMKVAETNNQVEGRDVRAPLVAIIGRPNVGKSTLFNRIVGSRRSIVGDLPGITRDRIYAEAEWQGRRFRLVDTGGMIPTMRLRFRGIIKQAEVAIEEAALLLLVVDVRAGVSVSTRSSRIACDRFASLSSSSPTSRYVTCGQPRGRVLRAGLRRGLPCLGRARHRHRRSSTQWLRAYLTPRTVRACRRSRWRSSAVQMSESLRSSIAWSGRRESSSAIPGTTRDAIDTLIESVEPDGTRIVCVS